jgi:hypothetical protein
MKKTISVSLILLAIFTVISAPASFAEKVGDIIGEAFYTDFKAYVDEHSVAVYSVNSKPAVSVESLIYYGFDVSWDSQARKIKVYRNRDKSIDRNTYVALPDGKNNGDKALDIYHSDIAVLFDDVRVKSFNTDICTLVYLDDIAAAYSREYKVDEQEKIISIKLAENPTNEWMKRTGKMMIPYTAKQYKFINFIRKNGVIDENRSYYTYVISDSEESGIKTSLTYYQFEHRVAISLSLSSGNDKTEVSFDLIPDSDGYCAFRADTISDDGKAGFSAGILASELSETDDMPSFDVLHSSGDAKILKILENSSKVYIKLLIDLTFSNLTDFSLADIIQSNN